MGWYGLVLVNILSFLGATACIFLFVERYTDDRTVPWLAAIFFSLGGFGIEYAQGVWPHMLAVFLCTSAVFFASDAWRGEVNWKPALAGFLAGMAAGVREQNIFFAACLGLTLLLFGRKRIRSTAFYALGIALPILIIMLFNRSRFDTSFPAPKSGGYLHQVESVSRSVLSPLKVFWTKVVDFSTMGRIDDPVQAWNYKHDPDSGAYLVTTAVKKSLLQSSPWISIALLAVIAAWFRRNRFTPHAATTLRALSLIIVPIIVMIVLAGKDRMDGLAFNQRYFHEVVPLSAIVAALAIQGIDLRIKNFVTGFLVSVVLFLILCTGGPLFLRHIAILYLPLFLAALAGILWLFQKRLQKPLLLTVSLGMCIGWALSVHVGDDLAASRSIRHTNARKLAVLDSLIPDHSALFVNWGERDGAGPLQLSKDVLMMEFHVDSAATAAPIKDSLFAQGRKVFVVPGTAPASLMQRLTGTDSLVEIHPAPYVVDEIIRSK